MLARLLVVLVLLALAGAATLAYRRGRVRDEQRGALDPTTGAAHWPDLPPELGSTGTPTWVIFTTPLCVSCEAVRTDLAAHDPASRVLTVDATERPDLSDRYGVRRAPTTVRADRSGRITERLVGPEAVRAHLAGPGRAQVA